MDLTLNQLRVFVEAARRGRFGQAAEALFVSAPAVSKSVSDLERQVGMELFERIGRRTQLTEAGKLLLPHAERIMTELADAERGIATLRGGETGRLRIGASSTPGIYLLPEILGGFRRGHSGAEIALEIGDTRSVLTRIIDGSIDIGVLGEAEFPAGLSVEAFCDDILMLILPPSHPLAGRKRIDLAALTSEQFVLREPGSRTREVLERALRVRGFAPKVIMELDNTEAVKKAVMAGLGVSFVSEHALSLETAAGVLLSRRVAGLDLERSLHTVWRRSFPLTPLHERVLTTLRQRRGEG
ncbi:MAG: LysR substrate-binding domain-containing protein [Actinomycetota bacterium]